MGDLTITEVWTALLAAASAFLLLSNAAEKIIKAIQTAKAPNLQQDNRLHELEAWKDTVEVRLCKDNDRLEGIEEGNRVSQRALLALLNHGIDGNNIEQMQHAKDLLQNHLINR